MGIRRVHPRGYGAVPTSAEVDRSDCGAAGGEAGHWAGIPAGIEHVRRESIIREECRSVSRRRGVDEFGSYINILVAVVMGV